MSAIVESSALSPSAPDPPSPQQEYMGYLVAVATETPNAEYMDPPPNIPIPSDFFVALMVQLSDSPLTRTGLDRMLDILLLSQVMDSLLDAPADFATFFETERLPLFPARFAPYWSDIIQPALYQLSDIRRALRAH